jgi:hypothetical protein
LPWTLRPRQLQLRSRNFFSPMRIRRNERDHLIQAKLARGLCVSARTLLENGCYDKSTLHPADKSPTDLGFAMHQHQLDTRYGPVFFELDERGHVAVRHDTFGMPEVLLLMLIRDHIRRGGLEQHKPLTDSAPA